MRKNAELREFVALAQSGERRIEGARLRERYEFVVAVVQQKDRRLQLAYHRARRERRQQGLHLGRERGDVGVYPVGLVASQQTIGRRGRGRERGDLRRRERRRALGERIAEHVAFVARQGGGDGVGEHLNRHQLRVPGLERPFSLRRGPPEVFERGWCVVVTAKESDERQAVREGRIGGREAGERAARAESQNAYTRGPHARKAARRHHRRHYRIRI